MLLSTDAVVNMQGGFTSAGLPSARDGDDCPSQLASPMRLAYLPLVVSRHRSPVRIGNGHERYGALVLFDHGGDTT